MTGEHFCHWLSGFLQLERPKTLSEKQVGIIEDHLILVLGEKSLESGYLSFTPITWELDENGNRKPIVVC